MIKESPLKITLLILPLLFIFHFQNVFPETELEKIKKDINIYLLTSRILEPQDSVELGTLINEFLEKEQSPASLKEIAYMVTNKIVRDRANLQFLVFDLEKLAEDNYSARIAKIKKNHFKTSIIQVRRLSKEMRKRRPKFNKPEEPLNRSDYIKIIRNNGSFLINQRMFNIFKVFSNIEKSLKIAYPRWLKRYNKLLTELKNSGKEPEEIFSDSEIKFLKVFGRVHIYYKKLKGEPIME